MRGKQLICPYLETAGLVVLLTMLFVCWSRTLCEVPWGGLSGDMKSKEKMGSSVLLSVC